MSKLFTVAGFSGLDTATPKFRVANGTAKARTGILLRAGCTGVDLRDMPVALTKEAAEDWAYANIRAGAARPAEAAPVAKAVKSDKQRLTVKRAKAAPKAKRDITPEIREDIAKFIAFRKKQAALAKLEPVQDLDVAEEVFDFGLSADSDEAGYAINDRDYFSVQMAD
jgi:hypothetical protein